MPTEYSRLINSSPCDQIVTSDSSSIVIDPRQCSIKSKDCYGKVAPSNERYNCAKCHHFCCDKCSDATYGIPRIRNFLIFKIECYPLNRICSYCSLSKEEKIEYAKKGKIPE